LHNAFEICLLSVFYVLYKDAFMRLILYLSIILNLENIILFVLRIKWYSSRLYFCGQLFKIHVKKQRNEKSINIGNSHGDNTIVSVMRKRERVC